MKTISKVLIAALLAVSATACIKYDFDIDYKAPIVISFNGVDESNIVTLQKGERSYSAKIVVTSDEGLDQIQIATADASTGIAGDPVEVITLEGEKTKTIEYTFENLANDAAIRVTASDINAVSVSKNLVVALTPEVIINRPVSIETAEVFYGVYYASWLGGRVYLRTTDNVEKYKGEIDLAFAEVDGKPLAISPADRFKVYNQPNLEGLHATQYAECSLTPAEYKAISMVDRATIEALSTDNMAPSIEVKANGVYTFLRDDGVKGVFMIESLTDKTATVEDAQGNWTPNTLYRRMSISAKILVK